MKENRTELSSCLQCLKRYLSFDTEMTEQEWESLGRDNPQCEPCIAALKERHITPYDDKLKTV